MSVPWQPARDSRGLLLVRAKAGPVSGWVRRGLVACDVVPLGEWTALLPAERASRASAPYDDAIAVLAGRSAAATAAARARLLRRRPPCGDQPAAQGIPTLAPLVGLGARDRSGAHPGPRCRPAASSSSRPRAAAPPRPRSTEVLKDDSGDAPRLLRRVLEVLALPGADLLTPSDAPRGQVVAPTAQAVARFESRMAEQAQHRAELEES